MHEYYMKEALNEAHKTKNAQDVPVGAVIVYKNKIIAVAHNTREKNKISTGHAEINAINKANEVLGTWNLSECDLYVTLEPCAMCAGACIQARIGRVIFGAKDPKGGSFGSTIDFTKISGYNHYPEIISGICEQECAELLTEFFKKKREEKITVRKVMTKEQFTQIRKIREEVFIKEQKVDKNEEYDEYDTLERKDVLHVYAKVGEHYAGTLRMVFKGKQIKVGRVAVLKAYRENKIGSRMMTYVEKYAKNNGYNEIVLGAQVNAQNFYVKNGYQAFGELFYDANIKHIMMKKTIVE